MALLVTLTSGRKIRITSEEGAPSSPSQFLGDHSYSGYFTYKKNEVILMSAVESIARDDESVDSDPE